jgi:hypothetical protein
LWESFVGSYFVRSCASVGSFVVSFFVTHFVRSLGHSLCVLLCALGHLLGSARAGVVCWIILLVVCGRCFALFLC